MVGAYPSYSPMISPQPRYDLNSSPSINSNILPNVANPLHFTPVTPDQAANMRNEFSTISKSTIDESTSQETDSTKILVQCTGDEETRQHGDELLQSIVDSSSTVISITHWKMVGSYPSYSTAANMGDQCSRISKSIVDESTSQERDNMKILVECTGDEAAQQHGDELLQSIVDSSSTIISTPYKEKKDFDKTSDLRIDLNKTPQQNVPKRRKHRPKVIKEGKPKGTPKSAILKTTEPKETYPRKRKYVRKNLLKDLKAQGVDILSETRDSNARMANSCRRALNFDMEKIEAKNQSTGLPRQEEVQFMNNSNPNINLDYQGTKQCNKTNNVMGTISTIHSGIPQRLTVQNQLLGKTSNGVHFINQMPNVDQQQKRREDEYTLKQQYTHTDGIGQDDHQGKVNHSNLEESNQLMMQGLPQMLPKTPSYSNEVKGSKGEHCHAIQHPHLSTRNHIGPSLYNTFLKEFYDYQRNYNTPRTEFSQAHKRKKIGDDNNIQKMPSNAKEAENMLRNVRTNRAHDVHQNGPKSNMDCALLNSHSQSYRDVERENNGISKFAVDGYIHRGASGYNSPNQQISSKPDSSTRRTGSTKGLTQVNSFSTQTTIQKSNYLIPYLWKNSIGPRNDQFQTFYNSMSEKKNAKAPLSGFNESQDPSSNKRGPKKKQTHPTPIDEIIYKFRSLTLDGSSNGKRDQNALVLYKGNGAVVPYEGLEFIKKRKPRPKVELDPETNRIWNLLMGKEGSEDLEGTDKEKEKWWEEERKVFRGRVDSFIARMHLVQGDRRFSRWKGSVVDSVIGVFLTQNVSDHLSSSAFMSLAARFPLKSTCFNTQDKVETIIANEDATISIVSPDDTIKWHEVSREPNNNRNITPHESTQHQWGTKTTKTKRSLTESRSPSSLAEFILSQNSFDSSITQVTGGIKSCSGSNSEAYPCTACKTSDIQVSSFTICQWIEKNTSTQEVCGHVNESTVLNEKSKHEMKYDQLKSRSGSVKNNDAISNRLDMEPVVLSGNNELQMTTDSRAPEVWCFETLSEGSMYSWHSTVSRSCKGQDANSQISQSGEQEQQNGLWKPQNTATVDPYALLSAHTTYQRGIPQLAKMQNATVENVPNVNKLMEKTFEARGGISAVNMQINRENKLFGPSATQQICSSDHANNATNKKISKSKKGNPQGQKKNEVDWDNLRKQVETKGGTKERRKETVDSLDYELVRTANVNEISDAIKERGMNNMLAERIKEFLNRLVTEHGSIDLEWLRDVPPDKAKDYLLSIRGLGLKSVECVRLLTLHHLAFPVDTNVGRIAVRLGWVPLQPLPESLQLHLLELYPVLESIQKYLWPRLCKLDQRTLYELHYQMITFGKVFCTKSKPNCNACPMRGECRHFASAFASARLALPGPEDTSIMSSTIPIAAANNPAIAINPMPLPPLDNGSIKVVVTSTGKCEPIIEEPATPEQECAQISQSDIEDSFYEDPDEIPTINLNIKEFTETLQNYMQNNMELQEGDMSKALVALDPNVASIPIPKLKNISRLRTEHQVYELPDSHPLLEQLDGREPDDPSPYLLAIWTPGETANTIQPPERSCSSQEPDKLCNEETCFSCNSAREANSQTVRGTILIPCRTAMRGSFPLNGTYFQVNEMFADHDSSLNPINVPREWIWNLPRRMVYFGTSVSTIFKGLSTEGIQYCFWKGFVCVRGFERTTRAPRPLIARLHFPASKLVKTKNDDKR